MLREVPVCSGEVNSKFAKVTKAIGECALWFDEAFVGDEVEVVVAVGCWYALSEDDVFVSHFRVGVGVGFMIVDCAKDDFWFTEAEDKLFAFKKIVSSR